MASRGDGAYTFAVCLTHDIDRVYKTPQNYLFNCLEQRDPRELTGLLAAKNPYWQFERIMALESMLGVRSAFYVLDERHITERPKWEWATLSGWSRYSGRYDVTDPQLVSTLESLENGGWEVGLQGSYTSPRDPARLRYEKERIEDATERPVRGNRQHYLNLSKPQTWEFHREIGLDYDTSLADPHSLDFQYGHELRRPFDDEFVVFPWTIMDQTTMESARTMSGIKDNVERILEEVREENGVLVLDWHQRTFYDSDFPGWGSIYRWAIERALEMGAWVGPPREFYDATSHPDGTVEETLETLANDESARIGSNGERVRTASNEIRDGTALEEPPYTQSSE
ncbi:polysaccharide deacetylase family protein [Halostagnicola sp. A-GB9-2]|uniref:polysaccharide deacetylase family protein n=1 Tax=Halostagnicola sp. A-GB9-2 TaxID=3048066 RepID=UPI0024C07D6E|nr:polysaccharide deacetylase family protein [Halostagnicola sp. A-GB9-2]MDJ1433893.1 polysaccharide deacetylase family protein [Halostagnicola sp. A-GB9-2]